MTFVMFVFVFVFCGRRFFLFSDQLVYAHQLFSGDWKMHEQLLLALVKVVDVKVGRNATRHSSPLPFFFFFLQYLYSGTYLDRGRCLYRMRQHAEDLLSLWFLLYCCWWCWVARWSSGTGCRDVPKLPSPAP